MSTFGKPLLPAFMALRCVRRSVFSPLTEGKIYCGVFAPSRYTTQYVYVRDDRGEMAEFWADRFEPVNPARRCQFKHLREKAVTA